MKVGFVQPSVSFGEFDKNVNRLSKLVATLKEWDLLVLPELVFTGYSFLSRSEVIEYGKKYMEPSLKWLTSVSKEYGGTVVAGLVEYVDDEHVYNSAAIANNGELMGIYRKIHLFYREKLYFNPGDEEPKVYDVGRFKLGVIICYDWMFPEVTRILALQGAEVIAHPSALVYEYAFLVMRARAIENKVFVITANRVGAESRGGIEYKFNGGSQIVSPWSDVLVKAGNQEEARVIEIDLHLARDKKYTELNNIFLDRNVKLYGKILST